MNSAYSNPKKPRSLKELINEPDGVAQLTDNFIEDSGVAPITACGTRWIAKKAKIKADIFGYVSRRGDY